MGRSEEFDAETESGGPQPPYGRPGEGAELPPVHCRQQRERRVPPIFAIPICVHKQGVGKGKGRGRANGGLGYIDPFGGMKPLTSTTCRQQVAGSSSALRGMEDNEVSMEDEEDEEDIAAARARLRAKQAKEQAAKNILGGSMSPQWAQTESPRQPSQPPRRVAVQAREPRQGAESASAWEKVDRPASSYSRALGSRRTNYPDFRPSI